MILLRLRDYFLGSFDERLVSTVRFTTHLYLILNIDSKGKMMGKHADKHIQRFQKS